MNETGSKFCCHRAYFVVTRSCNCRFMVSAHFTNYDVTHLVINLVVLAILIAAKLPELHGM